MMVSMKRLNRMGVAGILAIAVSATVFPSAGWAATVFVNQIGTTFVPNDITISVGDTVTWVWNSLPHTVTNGTGAADPQAGTLFDAALSGSNFSYTFTSAGDVDYFCRPHEFLGMKGIVRVTGPMQVPSMRPGVAVLIVAMLVGCGMLMFPSAARANPR